MKIECSGVTNIEEKIYYLLPTLAIAFTLKWTTRIRIQCFNVFWMFSQCWMLQCWLIVLLQCFAASLKNHSTLFTKQRASSERVCFKIWALRKFLTYNSVQIRDNKREWKWDGAEKKSADNLFYDAALEETDTHIHTHNMNW